MKNFLILLFLITSACSQNSDIHYDPPTPGNTNQTSVKSWNINNFPLKIYVPTELDAYRIAIENSAETWRSAFNRPVFEFIFDDGTNQNTQWNGPLDSLYDSFFGLFKMTSWSFVNIDNGVLAFTGTLTQSGTIIHADVLFNFKNYKFGDVVLNPTDSTLVDYESVLTHELGHFLGLNHIDIGTDPISIMNPTIKKGQSKRYLSPDDLFRIKSLYNIN